MKELIKIPTHAFYANCFIKNAIIKTKHYVNQFWLQHYMYRAQNRVATKHITMCATNKNAPACRSPGIDFLLKCNINSARGCSKSHLSSLILQHFISIDCHSYYVSALSRVFYSNKCYCLCPTQ